MTSPREHAMNYLARREHSRVELQRKLANKGHAHDVILTTLNRLTADGLQSDQRFTEAYTRARRESGIGPRRIQQELQQKGVAAALISTYINESSLIWRQSLQAVWQRKYNGERPQDAQSYARQMRFLTQRGFNAEAISQVLRRDSYEYQ